MWQPVALLAVVTVVCGAAALVAAHEKARYAALGGAGLTLTGALGSQVTTLVVAALVSGGLFALSGRAASARANDLTGIGAVTMAGLTLAAGLAVADLGQDVVAVALGLLGFGVLVAAQAHRGATRPHARLGFELGAGVVLAVGVVLALDHVDVILPVALTVSGLGQAVVGLVSPDRRLLLRPAGVLFAGATWVRLWSQDVTVVEAYTLPSAVVLVALGWWRMRRSPASDSITTLGPGLSLALLPSLLVALPEPTSLRSLLLGVAALVVLLAGVALRWGAPLMLGSLVVFALALVNVAPYAAALPRWVLFATVGAGLLFLGVSWEHRLRNARSLASAVQRLR
jgi:hypothetical protein